MENKLIKEFCSIVGWTTWCHAANNLPLQPTKEGDLHSNSLVRIHADQPRHKAQAYLSAQPWSTCQLDSCLYESFLITSTIDQQLVLANGISHQYAFFVNGT